MMQFASQHSQCEAENPGIKQQTARIIDFKNGRVEQDRLYTINHQQTNRDRAGHFTSMIDSTDRAREMIKPRQIKNPDNNNNLQESSRGIEQKRGLTVGGRNERERNRFTRPVGEYEGYRQRQHI